MVREGRKCSESVRRSSSIGHKCQNMCPEPGVAHQRHISTLSTPVPAQLELEATTKHNGELAAGRAEEQEDRIENRTDTQKELDTGEQEGIEV
jgi:hypothetical protein